MEIQLKLKADPGFSPNQKLGLFYAGYAKRRKKT